MRFLRYIVCAFLFIGAAIAETININWLNNGETYAQTTCEIGGDVILPTPLTKRGYTFVGWLMNYTPLEYIESSGIQYIDTGIAVNTLTNPIIETEFTTTDRHDKDFFGTSNVTTATIVYDVVMDDFGTMYVRWGSTISRTFSGSGIKTDFTDGFHKLKIEGTTTTIISVDNSKELLSNTGFTGFDNTSSILIFRGRSFPTNAKFRNFRIIDNDIPLFNGVAAKRNSDGVVGMWDTVSGQFFTNAGAGEFIAGPVAENQSFSE